MSNEAKVGAVILFTSFVYLLCQFAVFSWQAKQREKSEKADQQVKK